MITATWRTRLLAVALAAVTLPLLSVLFFVVISEAFSRHPGLSSLDDLSALGAFPIAVYLSTWFIEVLLLTVTLIVMIWWRRAWLVPVIGVGLIVALTIVSVATI